MKFDHDKFIGLYKLQYGALDNTQTSGLSGLLGFFEKDNHVSDMRWAAYMLATVKHECANRWQPIEEIGKGQGMVYGTPIKVRGNDGKTYTNTYYGRGYVQLTWVDNYRKMSYNLNLGDDILIHPERALEASIAYRIMSFGMRNGFFTGARLSDYISDSQCDYYDARQIINGHDQAALIQGYAQKLEVLLRESSDGIEDFSPLIPTCNDVPKPLPDQTAIKGDDYPFRNAIKDVPDGWGFDCRECTSFVAWRIRQQGVAFNNGMKGGWFGNARAWADNARKLGYRVDHSPSVGAIAHYDANAFLAGPAGHVAYVAQVSGDGSIVIEEYNWGTRASDAFAYHNPPRIIHASQVSHFIHIL